MEFLKTLLAIVLILFIAVILLAVMAVGFVVGYIAWVAGVPVKVTVNGKKGRYRWLKRVA